MQLYYNVANHVAYRIYVHGLDHKDKVQECVIKAWLALGEHPKKDIIPLVYTIMRNHLISLSRPTYNERKTTLYTWDEATILQPPHKLVIPLPSYKEEHIMAVAWIECEGKLKKACDSLGINYWTGIKLWKSTKDMIRKKGFNACMLDSDQLWLGGWR